MPRFEKPGIYLETTGVLGSSKGPKGLLGKKHAYLVYRRADGTADVIRGGPDSQGAITGDLAVVAGEPLIHTDDAQKDGVPRPSKRLAISPEKLDDVWDQMKAEAAAINNASLDYEIPYWNRTPVNSNAVVWHLLELNDIDPISSLPDGLSESDLPGFDRGVDWRMGLRKIESDNPQGARRRKETRELKQRDVEPLVPRSASELNTPMEDRVDDATLSPDAADLRDALMPTEADDYGVDALMRKPVDDLTETDVQVLQDAAFDERDTEMRHLINDRLQDFYRLTYGGGPAQHDETGKMIPPKPIREVPTTSSPVRGPSGETINDGLGRIAKVMAQAAQRDGGAKIAESLQSGLNIMGQRLKVDGVVGPKTRAAIKDTIAENGSRQVAAAAALGRFKSFAKDAKVSPKEAGNLRAVVQSDIQPLLDNPSAPSDRHEAPKALQRGLNILNPMTQLKVDGDIGPKTTAAFQAALANADENAVTESIASSLGFRA